MRIHLLHGHVVGQDRATPAEPVERGLLDHLIVDRPVDGALLEEEHNVLEGVVGDVGWVGMEPCLQVTGVPEGDPVACGGGRVRKGDLGETDGRHVEKMSFERVDVRSRKKVAGGWSSAICR